MDAPDFISVHQEDAGIFNVEVYSDIKETDNHFGHFQTHIEQVVQNVSINEQNSRITSLFDIDKDSDVSNSVKIETIDHLIVNSNATEDESMAVEALRQLGNSTLYSNMKVAPRIETKTPQDLPLLPCPTCHLQFRTTADLNNHSSICKHIQFKCHTCSKIFDYKLDLNVHMLSHLVDSHICRVCNVHFEDKKGLSSHMVTHKHGSIVNRCPVCWNVFNRPSSLTNHMKIHNYQAGRAVLNSTPKILETAQLSDILSGNENDEETNKKVPLPSLNSLICNLYYDINDDNFNMNLDVADDMKIDNSVDIKSLKDSVNDFTKTSITTKEDKIGKRPHICVYCSKSFSREKALASHLKLHSDLLDNYYQCETCDECFNDDKSLLKHQSNCKIQVKKSTNLISNSTVKNLDSFHVVSLDQLQLSKHVSTVKVKVNKHSCEECGKAFATKQKLCRHMWIHRKKVHTCEMCLLIFDKQEELDSHRLSMHYKSSPYVCSECGKNFSSRQGLWEHGRTHGDETQYKCSECAKTFSSRQGYMIHKRKHTDERPYGCRFCWKTFRDGGTLRKHERIHTGERPHACPLCKKAFNQKVVLREHVRWLHTANKQPNDLGLYECSICGVKVNDKEILCAHIVKHSDKMALIAKDNLKNGGVIKESDEKIQEDIPKTKTKNDSIKNVENKVCENPGGDVLTFIQDIVSGQQYTAECDLCGDRFLNKSDLSEHILIHI